MIYKVTTKYKNHTFEHFIRILGDKMPTSQDCAKIIAHADHDMQPFLDENPSIQPISPNDTAAKEYEAKYTVPQTLENGMTYFVQPGRPRVIVMLATDKFNKNWQNHFAVRIPEEISENRKDLQDFLSYVVDDILSKNPTLTNKIKTKSQQWQNILEMPEHMLKPYGITIKEYGTYVTLWPNKDETND